MQLTRRRVLAGLGALVVVPLGGVLLRSERSKEHPGPQPRAKPVPTDEEAGRPGTGTGYPTFSLTARIVSVDGAPPSGTDSWQLWIAGFGQTDDAKNASSKQSIVGGDEITLVADQAVLSATDATYAPVLNNSFTNLWQSTMASLVCKPARPFKDTLEVGGTITVTETDRKIPYTARLFPPPAGTTYVPHFGLMAFRLLSNGKFPTSATDSDGTAHVWTQARFLQRYRDRIISVDPKPPPRPTRIQLVQNGNPGDLDRGSWEVFYDILRRLGTTTTQAHNQVWAPAEIQRASDIDRFSIGLYNPPGYMFPFSPGNPGGSSPQVPDAAGIAAWAQSQVDGFLAAGYPDVTALSHIKIADEPGEYQSELLTAVTQPWGPATANKMRDEATRQATLANFRDYLAAQSGLTPSDVNYPDGYSTVPGPVGRSNENGTLAARTLYYWSTRWFSHLAAQHFSDCADALRAKIPGIHPTVSLNNYSGMLWRSFRYESSGRTPTADDGQLSFDWHELGRMGGLVGVDDYISEMVISNNALRTASCVRDHATGKMFSNEVVVSGIGTRKGGLLKKILVNTGRGSDRVQMYLFGPANVNKDGAGAEDLINGEHAVSDYQRLSRWLAETEDDLVSGSPPPPEVAVVAPRSTLMFNGGLSVIDSAQGSWWATTVDYMCEALSLVTVLTHANIESHWMDEDRLGDATYLKRFKVIYLTAPCIPAEYHSVILAWVSDGGTLVTCPGAGASDRYDNPTNGILSIGGLTESPHIRQGQPNLSTTQVLFSISGTQGPFSTSPGTTESWRTVVGANGGVVEATFTDNANPAMIVKPVGAGRRVHFACFLAQGYFYTGLGTGSNQRPPTKGWSDVLRAYLTRPVSLAGVNPPVSIDQPLVEGLLLKSAKTTALTLLNWRAEPVIISGTISGAVAGTRLVGRYGDIRSSYADGVIRFGPMTLDDCDILVAKGNR